MQRNSRNIIDKLENSEKFVSAKNGFRPDSNVKNQSVRLNTKIPVHANTQDIDNLNQEQNQKFETNEYAQKKSKNSSYQDERTACDVNNIGQMIFNDPEKTLIVILIVLLLNENEEPGIIIALLCLII